jgi:hypothetical protein
MNGTPPRGKALPPRPSADLGYREGQGKYGGGQKAQNGYRNDENANPRSYEAPKPNGPRGASQEPNARIILEGYRNEIMNGFESPKPQYNPVSSSELSQEWALKGNDERMILNEL